MRELDTSIQFLPGVGPKRAAMFADELGIVTMGDLLHFYPFRYIDRSSITPISRIEQDLAFIQIKARVVSRNLVGEGSRAKRLSVIVNDGSGNLELVFFKGLKWTYDKLAPGQVFIFFGKPQFYNGRCNMVHPEIDAPDSVAGQGCLTGVYPMTEKLRNSGVTGKTICKMQSAAIGLCLHEVEETLPDFVIKSAGLCPLVYALRNIHFPADQQALSLAVRRLKYEELFYLQLSLLKQKYTRSRGEKGILMEKVGQEFHDCYNALPYNLTRAQQRVIKEIRADLQSGIQMNRLVQGDVGSGKTMVAVLSCLIVIGNGCQACIMAPTEVLSQQHYANILKYLAPTSVKAALLTGSTSVKARREILEGLADGSISMVVGTHALIEDTVVFKNLGLAVIDEQHRFGVEQRARLWKKNVLPPHVLVMTATPIPRTLAMTVYGDLDISVIDEMPPGRKPVQTVCITPAKRVQMYNFIRKEIAAGRQAFIVYPMIYENDKLDVSNVEQGYEEVLKYFPDKEGYKVAIVHGKQTAEVKNFFMSAFAEGRAHILVSTTVIEVGVDVPNASVMVIESAERFGLSQLHQLRGRVGRGADKSYCILVRDYKASVDSRKRLELMCRTEDGFTIAEEDMKMRGPGDIEGTAQSGLPVKLEIASLARDGLLMAETRQACIDILDKDPLLEQPQNALLVKVLRGSKIKNYASIS